MPRLACWLAGRRADELCSISIEKFVTRLRALRSGVDPRLNQFAEPRLRAGGGIASGARLPAACNQIIVGQMLVQKRKVAAAVAIGFLDLTANLADRLAFPRHSIGAVIQRGCPGMPRYDARSWSVKLRSL